WTKQSFAPFSGVMKPKPLLSLNHFTVPMVRIPYILVLSELSRCGISVLTDIRSSAGVLAPRVGRVPIVCNTKRTRRKTFSRVLDQPPGSHELSERDQ